MLSWSLQYSSKNVEISLASVNPKLGFLTLSHSRNNNSVFCEYVFYEWHIFSLWLKQILNEISKVMHPAEFGFVLWHLNLNFEIWTWLNGHLKTKMEYKKKRKSQTYIHATTRQFFGKKTWRRNAWSRLFRH